MIHEIKPGIFIVTDDRSTPLNTSKSEEIVTWDELLLSDLRKTLRTQIFLGLNRAENFQKFITSVIAQNQNENPLIIGKIVTALLKDMLHMASEEEAYDCFLFTLILARKTAFPLFIREEDLEYEDCIELFQMYQNGEELVYE